MKTLNAYATLIADGVERIVEAALIVLMPVLTVVVVAQVVARYVIKQPLSWSEELSRYMLVWVVYLGMSVAIRRRGHMGFTVFRERLSPKLGRMLVFVSEVIIGVVLVYLLACGFRVSIANMTQNSPGLGIPMALAYGAVPIGALAGLIQLVPLIFDSFNGNC